MTSARAAMLAALAWAVPAFAQGNRDLIYDFALSEEFLQALVAGGSIEWTQPVHPYASAKTVHSLAQDCEMHVAARTSPSAVDPPFTVIEPPFLCKNPAPIVRSWPELMRTRVGGGHSALARVTAGDEDQS